MALTLLKNTAGADLGAASPVAVPLGEPVAQTRAYAVERTDQVETGIWECTPGRFRRQVEQAEYSYIVSGEGRFTPDEGQAVEFRAGDALYFAAATQGTWDIRQTVRKTYLIFD
ncbi:cupin domain-containing protein [Enterobacter hormaechei]|nr:cupin [Pseudomonas aeruginosa]